MEEQIIGVLKEEEGGAKPLDLCRRGDQWGNVLQMEGETWWHDGE